MSIFDNLRNWFLAPLLQNGGEGMERLAAAEQRRNYRQGVQRRYLKRSRAGVDDNLVINFSGLIVNRSVSMLLGGGVKFDLPGEGETPADQYIQAVMDANKQEILLLKAALLASEQGTGYLKIIPDAITYTLRTPAEMDDAGNVVQAASVREIVLPRLVALDPAIVRIDTRPDDVEDVLRYVIEYVIVEGQTVIARRETIERDDGVEIDEAGVPQIVRDPTWVIINAESHNGMPFVETSREVWPYSFPPVLHWQNLPNPTSVYGTPDLTDDVIELQDKYNFTVSNLSKIIRLYAHPQRFSRHFGTANSIEIGPDQMPNFNNDNGGIFQLEPIGDLAGAQAFALSLRQSLFDITQTVDFSSIADKIGALTNFGLRVLYTDALAKLGVKRRLFGDALTELVRRLLIIGGHDPDPGEIVWPEALPLNATEQSQVLATDMANGLVSKQTAAELRGYNWTVEQERMEAEREDEDNLGAALLRAFNAGQ